MANGVFTPYSTVSSFVSAFPAWVPTDEQERIASYQTYEEIYWNHPETFKLVVRGTEAKPIYIPSGRVIVETMNRYFARGLRAVVDPRFGTPDVQQGAVLAMENLFAREAVRKKFNMNKRYGLIRGDFVFHLTADPAKPAGSRLSITAVDPGSWFPVYDDTNLDRLLKVHLAEQFTDSSGKVLVKRQTYEKTPQGILSSSGIYEIDKWAKGDASAVTVLRPPALLPPQITAIPVYALHNFETPGDPYGASEMRGLERLMAAINQSVSDEDMALALEGLGVYATDGGAPVDDNGEPTDWVLGPGRVVEQALGFRRINGIGTVQPFGDHISTLWSFMQQASGANDAAIGKVDVQVAESGIALSLQLAPILARAEEKQDSAADTLNQMLYDIGLWMQAYEGLGQFNEVRFNAAFGDALPVNKKAEVDLAVALCSADPPIMSTKTAREHLSKKGIDFATDEFQRIVEEQNLKAELAAQTLDPYGARLVAEQEAADGGTGGAGANGAPATNG